MTRIYTTPSSTPDTVVLAAKREDWVALLPALTRQYDALTIEAHRLINDATTSAEAGSVVRVALPADMAAAVLVRA